MELSSPRFKALTVSLGFTFWFFILTSIFSIFTIEYLVIFVVIVFPLFQLLAVKVSKALDIFAIFNQRRTTARDRPRTKVDETVLADQLHETAVRDRHRAVAAQQARAVAPSDLEEWPAEADVGTALRYRQH